MRDRKIVADLDVIPKSALIVRVEHVHVNEGGQAVIGNVRSTAAERRRTATARLLRAYATQVEALRRLRHGGSRTLRVEHVHVNEGGQAVIGNVRSGAAGESN